MSARDEASLPPHVLQKPSPNPTLSPCVTGIGSPLAGALNHLLRRLNGVELYPELRRRGHEGVVAPGAPEIRVGRQEGAAPPLPTPQPRLPRPQRTPAAPLSASAAGAGASWRKNPLHPHRHPRGSRSRPATRCCRPKGRASRRCPLAPLRHRLCQPHPRSALRPWECAAQSRGPTWGGAGAAPFRKWPGRAQRDKRSRDELALGL